MKKEYQNRDALLYVLYSYKIMIKRNKKEYPAVLIDDLEKSIDYVLTRNDYTEKEYYNYRSMKK